MKTPCIAAFGLVSGFLAPLGAQNFTDDSDAARAVSAASVHDVPSVEKAPGTPVEGLPLIASQDSRTLEPRLSQDRKVDSVVDLNVLREPSAFRKVAAGNTLDPAAIPAEGMKRDLARISATYRESGSREADCANLGLSVEQRVKLDVADVLSTVEGELKANPGCSCEIVKAAIKATDADVEEVIAIVEAAITAAPEAMRIVSQCAIAAVPESLAGVQALLARFDPNAGDAGESSKSSKSAKSAKAEVVSDEVAAMPNPLDFPGGGPVGPTPGGPGGQPLIPPVPPIIIQPVTDVNP